MNLNFLPDELLAGIFKYSRYEELFRIRKLDSRMNRIAKTYDVGVRLPVRTIKVEVKSAFSYIYLQIRGSIWTTFGLLCYSQYTERKFKLRTEQFEMIDKLLLRLQLYREITIEVYHSLQSLDIMEVLCRNIKSFRLVQVLRCVSGAGKVFSEKSLRTFMVICPKLDGFFFSGHLDKHDFFDSEMFATRKWSEIHLLDTRFDVRGIRTTGSLNRNFLYNIIKPCEQFVMGHLMEVGTEITLMDTCLTDDKFFKSQHWYFPIISLGRFSTADVVRRLRNIAGIRVRLDNRILNASYECKIRIPTKPEVEIEFVIQIQW